ncbi:DUF222 domain-containing protein [Mycolicibacterium litorale]|nr:DUF222 domain-containing protein [Mycolicibacterium litorale]
MSSSAPSFVPSAPRAARLEVLFEKLEELAGQRNAIDGQIVEIAAEIDRDGLCGMTGARSVAALIAWKTGSSSKNGHTIAAVAQRLAEFPRCAAALREGRLSLDQVGVIAEHAGARTATRSPRWPNGSRNSRAAPRLFARAGCHSIRSGSSPNTPAPDPMTTTPNSPPTPRSASCAPRSNSNPNPNPNLNPNQYPSPTRTTNPSPSRSRGGRSPRPPTTNSPAGPSNCRLLKPQHSRPRCNPTTTG